MSLKVSGWVPYWQITPALTEILQNKDLFGDVLLFSWDCHADGRVVSQFTDPNPMNVLTLKHLGLPYWATFTSAMTGAEAAHCFSDLGNAIRLAKSMIAVARQIGATGLDLDFESINFGNAGNSVDMVKVNYPGFITLLKKNAPDLLVSATIPARTSDTDPDWACYDYAALGRAADKIRIMAYDYHDGGGSAGPVAPLDWCGKVNAYTKSRIPAGKVQMGVPAYGYSWPSGKTVNSKDAASLAAANGTTVKYDALQGEGTFTYAGETVWVATSQGIAQRARMAQAMGFSGIAIWSIHDQASDTFAAIRATLNPATPHVSLGALVKHDPVAVTAVQVALNKLISSHRIVGPILKVDGIWTPNGHTQAAFNHFRVQVMGLAGLAAQGPPGSQALIALGQATGFNAVR